MAVSVTDVKRGVLGDLKYLIADVTFDSSYPAGGEALTPATLGFTTIYFFSSNTIIDPDTADNAVVPGYDYTNSKFLAFWDNESGSNSAFLEVDDTTTLAAYSARIFVIGK